MKTNILTIILLCIGVSARAQDAGIVTSSVETRIDGVNLDLRFDIVASGVKIDCDGRRILEFAVENDKQRLVLPVVVYSGAVRYRYERRRELLSGSHRIAPYHIYKGVKRNRTYELEYRLTIPYEPWMAEAAITRRDYVHDCSGDNLASTETLVPDVGEAAGYDDPAKFCTPRPLLGMVSFLVPEVEQVKARAAMIELNIGFPVNVTQVRPAFGENRRELSRADSLVAMLNNSELSIDGVKITGYASPESSYENNDRLASGRAASFKHWMEQNYPDNGYIRRATVSHVAEDWERLGRMVEQSDLIGKQEALAIIYDRGISPDVKNTLLERITPWSDNYGVILRQMYPVLRRIEMRVDYTVPPFDDRQVLELLHTHPEYLSLDEMYRVAKLYEPGSSQYRIVYQIAAQQFPDDPVANHNAAAALLQEGNAAAAWPYLRKVEGRPESFINLGVYHYLRGERDKAVGYFERARAAGFAQQADQNLRSITK